MAENHENLLKDPEIVVHLINMYGQRGMINKSESVYNLCDEFENNKEIRKAEYCF